MQIQIKVTTNASLDEVIQLKKSYFLVKTTVAPEKGKANKAVIFLLSKYFKIPKSNISIIKGLSKKIKIIKISE